MMGMFGPKLFGGSGSGGLNGGSYAVAGAGDSIGVGGILRRITPPPTSLVMRVPSIETTPTVRPLSTPVDGGLQPLIDRMPVYAPPSITPTAAPKAAAASKIPLPWMIGGGLVLLLVLYFAFKR